MQNNAALYYMWKFNVFFSDRNCDISTKSINVFHCPHIYLYEPVSEVSNISYLQFIFLCPIYLSRIFSAMYSKQHSLFIFLMFIKIHFS